jgi:hypothetical protein
MRLLLAAAVLFAAGLGLHAADLAQRAAALNRFVMSSGADLHPIAGYDPALTQPCSPRPAAEVDALARALITVESLATPVVESWWKSALVGMLHWANAPIPDLTYGPGRVRLSTARRVLAGVEETDASIALRLLDHCQAKDIVARLVSALLKADGGPSPSHIDPASIGMVAVRYNGQAEAQTLEAAVAHETYKRLVLELFQHYRFARLSSR